MLETDCIRDCTGEPTSKCGGYDNLSVYRTRPQTKIDGGWSEWGNWVTSGEFCIKNRTRTCTNPAPSSGGANCISDGSSRMIFPGPLPVMPFPQEYSLEYLEYPQYSEYSQYQEYQQYPTELQNTSGPTGFYNTSDSMGFTNTSEYIGSYNTSGPTGFLNTSGFYNTSGSIGFYNTSGSMGFYNTSGPPAMPVGGPEEYEEPGFLPNNTESLQYQFMPWCAEDCTSKLLC